MGASAGHGASGAGYFDGAERFPLATLQTMEARPQFHLAQVNVAKPLGPPGSEVLAEFMAALAPINALADAAPGFVWRLQTDAGDATAVPVFGSTEYMVNLSVWADLESLASFVFKSGHVEVMRKRRAWFEPMTEAYVALWWVPAGVRPTVADAEERLLHVRAHGPTPFAFTVRAPFPSPSASEEISTDDDWLCPA
jgi:hypothetical protein